MEYIGEIIIKKEAEKKVRNFYLWIYEDEIKKFNINRSKEGWVSVISQDGRFVCSAYYSPNSRKAVKVFSYESNFDLDLEIKKRILFSFEHRKKLMYSNDIDKSNYRVVYSESDFLPGLVIDKYGDFVGIQIRNRLFEGLRDIVVDGIVRFLGVDNIYERSYGDFREDEEGLSPVNVPLRGNVPKFIRIVENGLQFVFETFKGQKTGFFLDQTVNRKIVSGMCNDGFKVLDIFSYVGGFGIYCAKRGANVVCIEKSEAYSDLIKENANSNGVSSKLKVITGDAFDLIKQIDEEFDIIILDPPTFVKSISESRKRLPQLIDLIKRSLVLLKPSGKLVIFTCSYNLLKEHFVAAIRIAGMELGVRLRVDNELLQSPDHPWILQMPETLYLKGFVISKLPSF
ncbi:MAG: class I SAM-dependent rRNA methyltransferase [Brevinematales bacterium]|nr:class I SAM-dependent rRNA methyltransferase [Brevinematales bacterium]